MSVVRRPWRRGALPCGACGTVPPAPRARFCGRCGALLDRPAGTPRSTDLPIGQRPRRRLLAAGSARTAVAAGLVVTLTGVLAVTAAPDRPAIEVPLPSSPALRDRPPLSDDDAARLQQQVRPDRLRCEPRGCERWRRLRADVQAFATVDDLVAVLEPGRLVALDADTGRERWTTPIGGLAGDGARHGGPDAPRLFAAANGIVLTARGHVALLDTTGAWRWRTDVPVDGFRRAVAVDGVLALHGSPPGSGGHRDGVGPLALLDAETGRVVRSEAAAALLHLDDRAAALRHPDRLEVVDPADGRPRWHRPLTTAASDGARTDGVDVVHVAADGVTVVVPGDPAQLAVLDLADGATRWTRPLPVGVEPVGGDRWIVVPDDAGDGSSHVVLDVASGSEVGRLDRPAVHPFTAAGGRTVTVTAADPSAGAEAELVALDRQGEIAWRVPLSVASAWRCCTRLVVAGDTVTARAGTERVRVEVRAGAVLDRWSDIGRNGTGYFLHRWYAPDGTRVQQTAASLTLEGPEGRAELRPARASVEATGPWVVADRDELLGVGLVPDR